VWLICCSCLLGVLVHLPVHKFKTKVWFMVMHERKINITVEMKLDSPVISYAKFYLRFNVYF